MDTIPPRSAGEGATPDAWGDLAKLPAQVVARNYLRQWAHSGLPGSLAAFDTTLETVWAAVQRRDREPYDHRPCQQLQQAAPSVASGASP